MPSNSLRTWNTVRVSKLDEIENAHRSVSGASPGRRYTTQQINYAYAVLLSSQFQGFCRDLHSECAQYVIDAISSLTTGATTTVIRRAFIYGRLLDKGNPTQDNIRKDFGVFGIINIIDEVRRADRRNVERLKKLEKLNEWRNAIAHQDFKTTGSDILRINQVRGWRNACICLAEDLDEVMAGQLNLIIGTRPW